MLGIIDGLSTMKRRADDTGTAKSRIAHFQRDFGNYPRAALRYLHDTARRELSFFPSPKECFDILARWERNDTPSRDRNYARHRVTAEIRLRFDEAMAGMSARQLSQEQIDALPDGWKAIAAERCYLRALRDGTYIVRGDTTDPDNREAEARKVRELREAGLL